MKTIINENDYGYNGLTQASKPRGKDIMREHKRKRAQFIKPLDIEDPTFIIEDIEKLKAKIKKRFGTYTNLCKVNFLNIAEVRYLLSKKKHKISRKKLYLELKKIVKEVEID